MKILTNQPDTEIIRLIIRYIKNGYLTDANYPRVKNILKFILPEAGGHKFCFLICLLTLMSIPKTYAQEKNYAIHANILFRFTKYIDWPESKKSGDFIIGIVGDTPLYDLLKTFIIDKTVGYQNILVQKFSSSAASYNCNILFISEDKSKSLKKICEQTKAFPILIVSESPGLGLKGSCINFVTVNDHLKLEINKNNILERNLNIASELLSLAIIVK